MATKSDVSMALVLIAMEVQSVCLSYVLIGQVIRYSG